MISGFGAERLGHLTLRFPIVATLIVIVLTAIALAGVPRLQFSGDNIDILRDGSRELAEYDNLLGSFRDFNNDAIVLIRSDRLRTLEGFEKYRDLHFELQFEPAVESILSPFSLVSYDASVGWHSTVPARFEDDAAVAGFLDGISEKLPAFDSLIAPSRNSAVIVIYTSAEAVADSSVRDTMAGFERVLEYFADEDFEVSLAGQPAIRADLINSIVDDLRLLAPIAALFCAVVALGIFRNAVAVILCVLPPVIAVLWFLGALGHAGIKLNFLTNVLPVLLMVIVFADTLHLYLKWEREQDGGDDASAAMGRAVTLVGPACALAMITTAIALASLTLSGNLGLTDLGWIGAVSILASFISVITVLPLGVHWAGRLGFAPDPRSANRLAGISRLAHSAVRHSALIGFSGVVVCLIGLYAHWNIDSRFRLLDYLGTGSQVAESESYIDERYSGTTPLFAIIHLDPSVDMLHETNTDVFYRAKARIDEVFPSTSSYSLDDFAREVEKGGGIPRSSDLDELPEYLTSRFVSTDRTQVLITIFSSASYTASQMHAKLEQLQSMLREEGLSDNVSITGFPILASVVAPRLMDNLRISLLAAVFVSIFVIALAARSWRIGLACLVPNLLPIVAVEIVLWLAGIPLDMSITVALTVSFGIAVDNSIHLSNQYMIDSREKPADQAILSALHQVAPAMVSTTLILVAGLSISLLSTLPVLSVFALVIVLTLIFALVTDIFQLPAYLVTVAKPGRNQPHQG